MVELISYIVKGMKNNSLKNYIVPGLTSHMIGDDKEGMGSFGKVRMFTADRMTRDSITPHSHRFSFACLVLAGDVENTIYHPSHPSHKLAEPWIRSQITQVCGANGVKGSYVHERESEPRWYTRGANYYKAGETYWMQHEQIHSIVFSKGAEVLFFEGPTVQSWDWMIEPYVDGKVVPSFKVEPWMFDRS